MSTDEKNIEMFDKIRSEQGSGFIASSFRRWLFNNCPIEYATEYLEFVKKNYQDVV